MSINIINKHSAAGGLIGLSPEPVPVLISIIEKQEWALKLSSYIDNTLNNSQDTYLECSSKSVSRTLAKLENLLQLENILNEKEREVLVAAQYLHTLKMQGDDLEKAKSILCQAIDNCEDMVTCALITTDAVRPDFDLESSDMKIGNIRCDLLAALLRIGKVLNLDREAIANRKFFPPVKDHLDHWQAFLTKTVIIRRGGLVTFHLFISKHYEEQNDLFIRFTSLDFEALWQKLRKILTHNGVAISRSPSRITVYPDIGKLPKSILKKLKEAIKDAEESIPRLLHLGYFPPSEFILSQIVPLPYSAIANPLTFKMDSDHDYTLILLLMDVDDGFIGEPLKFPFNGRQDIVLSPNDLQPSSTYRWWIIRNDRDFHSTVTTGCIKAISGKEMTLWKMANESNDEQKRRDVQVNLGLWNDIMIEIGQKIISDYASFDEIVLAHHGLLLAFEWLRDNSISTNQVDLYRNASAWVRSLFTTNKNKES